MGSDRVRVGVIGTSWWVDLMYRPSLTSHAGATVTAVCGRSEARAREIADKFGEAQVFDDYRQMLAADVCDAVVVSTPDDLHCEMALAAIAAGKHVLCEKPLAGTAQDARRMWEAAKAAKIKNMVLFTWRWQPHFRYLKQLLEQGYVGRVRHAEFRFYAGSALDGIYKWRFDGRRANGILGDLGSHMIDFVQWYLGGVSAVRAELRTHMGQPAGPNGAPALPVNDFAALSLDLVRGGRADVTVSGISVLGDEGVRICVVLHGEEGSIEVVHRLLGSQAGAQVRGLRKGDQTFATLPVPPEFLEGGVDSKQLFDPYVKQSAGARRFIDAIRSGATIDTDFEVGMRVQEIVDAALLSASEDRRVTLSAP